MNFGQGIDLTREKAAACKDEGKSSAGKKRTRGSLRWGQRPPKRESLALKGTGKKNFSSEEAPAVPKTLTCEKPSKGRDPSCIGIN